jgi:hypothetical protein
MQKSRRLNGRFCLLEVSAVCRLHRSASFSIRHAVIWIMGLLPKYGFQDKTPARACGGSPPHEQLRSRNSRHLQCCPLSFLVPSRHTRRSALPPGYCGGSWWRVTAYLLAKDIGRSSETPKIRLNGDRAFSIVCRFCRSNRNNTWQRPAA